MSAPHLLKRLAAWRSIQCTQHLGRQPTKVAGSAQRRQLAVRHRAKLLIQRRRLPVGQAGGAAGRAVGARAGSERGIQQLQ